MSRLALLTPLALAACAFDGSGLARPGQAHDAAVAPDSPSLHHEGVLHDGGITVLEVTTLQTVTGSGSCAEILGCVFLKDCDWNTPCEQPCLAKGTPEGKAAYAAVHTCEDTATAVCGSACQVVESTSCASCVDAHCQKSHLDCGSTFSCKETYDCFQQCPKGSLPCRETCVGQATLQSLFLFEQLWICLEECGYACGQSCQDPFSGACITCCQPRCAEPQQQCGL